MNNWTPLECRDHYITCSNLYSICDVDLNGGKLESNLEFLEVSI